MSGYNSWTKFYEKFGEILTVLPIHRYTSDILFDNNIHELNNSIIYSQKGFPVDTLIEYSLSMYLSIPFPIHKRYPKWNNTLPYVETNYYFCIDTEHPEFPKDINHITDFIKHIVNNKCIHLEKHIIVIKNLDNIANKNNCYIFRILLEKFNHNVLFITTTNNFQMIEKPLKSRMRLYRIPLPTIEQISSIIKIIDPYKNYTVVSRNLALNIFSMDNNFKINTNVNFPPLLDTQYKKLSTSQIRDLAYRIFQYKVNIKDIVIDCLNMLNCSENKVKWIHEASNIEWQSKIADKNKQFYFIELLLNTYEKYK
jgi:hypothetical protein